MNVRLLLCFAAAVVLSVVQVAAADDVTRPNVIVILADDVGYGDLGCYGAAKIKTPHLDRLAAEGLRFTDGHSTSATCTPSRYALLTGQYPWRKEGTGILAGDAALIIPPGMPTLPGILKEAGYATGCIGKWHLGLGAGDLDWNADIKPGPLEIGFDYSFIIPATGDRVPCVYVENRRVVGLDAADPIRVSYGKPIGDEPTGASHPELLKVQTTHGHNDTIVAGISRIGFMSGGKSARWKDEDMADEITSKALSFIDANRDRPFFLYFATHDIHVPRVPHPRFAGRSDCGTRGDVMVELDWCVGQLMARLDQLDLAKSTLVIFSSDNGPALDDGYADGAVQDSSGHNPAGPLRGQKYSRYEAGTRVPFIARWPDRIQPGVSGALVCQIDLMASLAALLETDLPAGASSDGVNVLSALLGKSKQGRDHLVEQGGGLAIRQGKWKYVPAGPVAKRLKPLSAGSGADELFNLADDLGETKNLAAQHPDRVIELSALLAKIRDANTAPTSAPAPTAGETQTSGQ